jgi:hypothetical protein
MNKQIFKSISFINMIILSMIVFIIGAAQIILRVNDMYELLSPTKNLILSSLIISLTTIVLIVSNWMLVRHVNYCLLYDIIPKRTFWDFEVITTAIIVSICLLTGFKNFTIIGGTIAELSIGFIVFITIKYIF